MRAILALVFTCVLTAPAAAQIQIGMCSEAAAVLALLKNEGNQVPSYGGMVGEMPMVITTSPDGVWTILAFPQPDKACVFGIGNEWYSKPAGEDS